MTLKIGRNRNSNDVASVSDAIPLGTGASTVIAVANPNRIFFEVSNNDAVQGCWIKLQPASVDDTKKGRFIPKKGSGETYWRMPSDNPYTGEISAIADIAAVDVYVTEY